MTAPIPVTPEAVPPRRRRRWPWIVTLIIVVALAIAAWFAGDAIARGIIEQTVRQKIVTELSLPADQQIDVDVPAPVLPGLLAGNIAELSISADDVSVGDVTADVRITAQDVPISGDGDWSGAYASVTLDQTQLQTLLGSLDGFPAGTVSFDPPSLVATFDLNALGVSVPVAVALDPSVEAGSLVLRPSSLRLAGVEISSEAIVAQFGALATTVVRDWDVCVAEYLPEAVRLTGVAVDTDAVTVDMEIDSSILNDGAAEVKGTCA